MTARSSPGLIENLWPTETWRAFAAGNNIRVGAVYVGAAAKGIGAMPDSWIWRAVYWGLAWVYTAGYSVYLFAVGWAAWPKMTFSDWFAHISWESVYALAWPLLIILSWLGYR
jgi:hypothetical protein